MLWLDRQAGTGRLAIASGNLQTDTIDGVLAQPLVVHVAGGTPGGDVQFASVSSPGGFVQAFVSASGGAFDTVVTVSLDNALNASANVKLGSLAGAAKVIVRAGGGQQPERIVYGETGGGGRAGWY